MTARYRADTAWSKTRARMLTCERNAWRFARAAPSGALRRRWIESARSWRKQRLERAAVRAAALVPSNSIKRAAPTRAVPKRVRYVVTVDVTAEDRAFLDRWAKDAGKRTATLVREILEARIEEEKDEA